MAVYLRTNLDPDGKLVRIESGVRAHDGTCYLVLLRMPPHYAKPPMFVVQLTKERMEVRGEDAQTLYKAYAIQSFNKQELEYLRGLKEGSTAMPFFNFSYPNVIKRMGKKFQRLTDAEISQLARTTVWKLVGGER